jgi:methylated-DNA-protein-cysteine methyltransferase-like protein
MFPRMLRVVARIPRGKVATYGDVAYIAGYPGSSRQVVWALRSAQGVPWHRVVGAGGKILLPAEGGMEQRFRLESEGVQFSGLRVDMDAHRWAPYRRKKSPRRTRRKMRGK